MNSNETTINQSKENENSLLNVIIECFSDSTLHALPKITKPSNHKILKIIWVFCLVGCTAYCCYSCLTAFQNYYSYPTTTKLSIVQELPTQFPAISFCNLKLLNRSNPNTLEYVNKNPAIKEAQNQFRLRFAFANDKNLNTEDRKEMGFKLENMLLPDIPFDFCYYDNDFCNVSDFTYFSNPAYGNCYSFNIGYNNDGSKYEIKQSSTTDKLYGLQLELFIGNPSVDTFQESSDGIAVSIHNQTIAPFSKGNTLLIPPGAETDIIINRNFISKLPAPHGNCLEDASINSTFSSPYFDYIVRTLKVNYSQEYCNSFCLQRQTINYCGCSNVFLAVYLNTTDYCSYNQTNQTQFDCVWTVNALYGHEFNDHCKKSCPFECYSIDFITTSSRSLYPTKYRLDELLFKSNYSRIVTSNEFATQAFLKVNFFYQAMQYTVTTQVSQMQQVDLLSKFGGTLGLFLGLLKLRLIANKFKKILKNHHYIFSIDLQIYLV